MKAHLHELAEDLERKRLINLKLNLSGLVLAGGAWLLNAHLIHSEHILVNILLALGTLLWGATLLHLVLIRRQINSDSGLKQFFNDELSAYNRLKTWKVGFITQFICLTILLVISFFQTLDAGFILQFCVFIGVATVLGASIVLEEMLSIVVFQEDFDTERYEVWNWKHWAFFHWILNPGIAFNELFLGQRAPKVLLLDKQSGKPLMESSHVPCPHCGTIHDARTWSGKNKTAFGHHYGYYCPNCGEIIPCLQNITSFILLAITYPIRLPFMAWHKRRWLAKQPARYEQIDLEEVSYEKVQWLKLGLIFGAIMFVFMSFFMTGLTTSTGDGESSFFENFLDPKVLVVNIVVWTLGGLGFGLVMKYLMGPKSPLNKSKDKKAA